MGGISLLIARSISDSTKAIGHQHSHVDALQTLHMLGHQLAGEALEAIASGQSTGSESIRLLITNIEQSLQNYGRLHRGEPPFPEQVEEIQRYDEILMLFAILSGTAVKILDAIHQGRTVAPQDVALVQRCSDALMEHIQRMAAIHQVKIGRLIQESERRMGLISAFYLGFLLVGILLIAMNTRLFSRITRQIRQLAEATLEVARGQLSRRVPVMSRDELGQLSASFNAMAARLEERQQQLATSEEALRRRAREAQALYRIGTQVSAVLDADRVIGLIVSQARSLLQADMAGIALCDQENGTLSWKAVEGEGSRTGPASAGDPGDGVAEAVLRTGRPVVADGQEIESRWGHDPLLGGRDFRSAAAVPLKRGDKILGVLLVGRREGTTPDPAALQLLAGLANHAAIALENARLYEQAQQVATLEERERLARELHDGIAQILGFLVLKASEAEAVLAEGSAGTVARQLIELRRVAEKGYEDVRQAIFGLRVMVSRTLGLIPTLTEYLHEYSQQTGIKVELQILDPAAAHLPPHVEIQLIRIIQEALANIWRHARASSARITFEREGGWLTVRVADDGRGFDPGAQETKRRSFGLQTMRERAQGVGGKLQVDSRIGHGTTVVAVFPAGVGGGSDGAHPDPSG
ncbi:MAG: GAF domain-containing protein [Deltaproteobacteria bacterium]|nr:GAF domain-containing protein [Deltaproteobacteria bacterium]